MDKIQIDKPIISFEDNLAKEQAFLSDKKICTATTALMKKVFPDFVGSKISINAVTREVVLELWFDTPDQREANQENAFVPINTQNNIVANINRMQAASSPFMMSDKAHKLLNIFIDRKYVDKNNNKIKNGAWFTGVANGKSYQVVTVMINEIIKVIMADETFDYDAQYLTTSNGDIWINVTRVGAESVQRFRHLAPMAANQPFVLY